MNVSKKVLVIIYIIFALLISIVIFASQSVLYSSFSNLEEQEAIGNVKKVKNIVDSQVVELDTNNLALASRNETRTFMQSPNPEYMDSYLSNALLSVRGCDLIFFVNSSGNVLHSRSIDPGPEDNCSVPPKILSNIREDILLCRAAGDNTLGMVLLDTDPVIVSSRPVLDSSGEKVLGTVIMGRYIDASFVESLQNISGAPLMMYRLDRVPASFQDTFFEDQHQPFMHMVMEDRVAAYYVLNDLSGDPVLILRTDLERYIYAEERKALRYLVFILLFAGLVLGAGCKFLLDKEVVSRLVTIDNFVEKVGKDSKLSDRLELEGDDELSSLTDGINNMLNRLERVQEEVKSQESERKLILNSLSELLIFIDPEFRVRWANRASLEFLHKELCDIVGHKHDEVCLLCEKDLEKSPAGRAFITGKVETGEIELHDGRIWSVRAIPVKDDSGKITGVLQTGLDITESKSSEQRLVQAKQEAEAANQAKSEFLANMSHELRTPLNSIIGFSDVLLEKVFGDLNETQFKYITNVSTSGKNLLGIINDILDLSKVEAGKMELRHSNFSIKEVFEEVETVLFPLASSGSIEMTFSLGPGFTDLEADRSLLAQILYNLGSNAIKFTPEGGKVSFYGKKVGDMAQISVSDTGIGIASKGREKLFQPFSQLDSSTSRKFGGTGLGLVLVKKIVNLHG
ncbi:MAG: CHASE4 domain-containing protein, partial [Methanosarcinaceae archaeon]|nr:CHASE4 domain-containing protein [Methanosarcinaceae archaeon]